MPGALAGAIPQMSALPQEPEAITGAGITEHQYWVTLHSPGSRHARFPHPTSLVELAFGEEISLKPLEVK